jgi:hypothetical protein
VNTRLHPEADVVVIERRYRGPPESANGGYACGIVARRLAGAGTVRLRLPPPVDTPLELRATEDGRARLLHDHAVVAEGTSASVGGDVPGPVPFESAVHASAGYRWRTGHPFPGCFVCGPDRSHGDGLRIFPGRVPGRDIVAASWVPDLGTCDASRRVRPEIVWAALDCPSWFGILEFDGAAHVSLLGQLTAEVIRRPAAGERCVVIGWFTGRDGRKLHGGAALYADGGELLGRSEATWIEAR